MARGWMERAHSAAAEGVRNVPQCGDSDKPGFAEDSPRHCFRGGATPPSSIAPRRHDASAERGAACGYVRTVAIGASYVRPVPLVLPSRELPSASSYSRWPAAVG